MRWWLALFLLTPLAGCVDAPTDDIQIDIASMTGFEATYLAPGCYTLIYTLEAPTTIAGPDLIAREAYPLHATYAGVPEPEDGCPSKDTDFTSTVYLDRSLRVVRSGGLHEASFSGSSGSGSYTVASVSWAEAGGLPPLGLLWDVIADDDILRFRVSDRTFELPLQAQGDRVDVPEDWPLFPVHTDGMWYERGAHRGIPERIRPPIPDAYPMEERILKLQDVTFGDALATPPDEMAIDAASGQTYNGLIPGDGRPFYNMGVSLEEIWHAIQDNHTEAQGVPPECISLIATPGHGAGWTDIGPIQGRSDSVSVLIMFIQDGIEYAASADLHRGNLLTVAGVGVMGTQGIRSTAIESAQGTDRSCQEVRFDPGFSFQGGMLQLYRIPHPTNAIPCSVWSWRFDISASWAPEFGDAMYHGFLTMYHGSPETGNFEFRTASLASASVMPATGLYGTFFGSPQTVADLDAGVHRKDWPELPDWPDPPTNGYFRCMEKGQGEDPVVPPLPVPPQGATVDPTVSASTWPGQAKVEIPSVWVSALPMMQQIQLRPHGDVALWTPDGLGDLPATPDRPW